MSKSKTMENTDKIGLDNTDKWIETAKNKDIEVNTISSKKISNVGAWIISAKSKSKKISNDKIDSKVNSSVNNVIDSFIEKDEEFDVKKIQIIDYKE